MLKQVKRTGSLTDPYGVHFCTNEQGLFISLSQTLLDYTGKQQEELLGQPVKDIFVPDDAGKIDHLLNATVAAATGEKMQLTVKGRNKAEAFMVSLQRSTHQQAGALEWWLTAREPQQEQRLWLDKAFDNCPQAVLVYHPVSFAIIYMNRAAMSLYGYSWQELPGLNMLQLYPALQVEEAARIINSIRQRSYYVPGYLQITKSGETLKVEGFSNPYHIGEELYRILFVHKVEKAGSEKVTTGSFVLPEEPEMTATEKELEEPQIREALRLQTLLLRNMSDAVIATDLDFNIVSWNPAAERLYGLSWQEVAGRSIHVVVKHHYINSSRAEALQQLQQKGSWAGEMFFIPPGDKPVYFRCTLSYIRDETGKPVGLVGIHQDITARYQNDQTLRAFAEQVTQVLDNITEGFIATNKSMQVLLWNQAMEKMTGCKAGDAVGKHIQTVFPFLAGQSFFEQYNDVLLQQQPVCRQHYHREADKWFEISVNPSLQGLFIYCRDITPLKKQERIQALERKVLELNAQTGVSLKVITDHFLEELEQLFPDMLFAILLPSNDQRSLHHLSAPGLPAGFTTALDGLFIEPQAGAFAPALCIRKNIFTHDIHKDPLWETYRDLARLYDVRACWAFPVFNAQNEGVALLTTYFRCPRLPLQAEVEVLEKQAGLLGLIIENKSAAARVQVSHERYLMATRASNDAIWDWDIHSHTLYWGEGFYNLFGYKTGYRDGDREGWEQKLHPDDRDRVLRSLHNFMKDDNLSLWQEEYRFRKADGTYALVTDRAFLVYNRNSEPCRLVGSMQDITQKRGLEKKLLQQKLDRQKMVAQTVVEAQEKERAAIGLELRDNVNQLLSTAKLYLELVLHNRRNEPDLLERSLESLGKAICEIRKVTGSLMPASIGDIGLAESVRDLVDLVKATQPLEVNFFTLEDIDSSLREEQKIMLFRIIQEQVNNVIQHAGATLLRIDIHIERKMVILNIEDDGIGFEPGGKAGKKGGGLLNIANRAELFNGKMTIKTAPGQGCKLNIIIPIAH